MSEKPNRITQTQGEDYDYKNIDGYWPDLQHVHPYVAVRYLDHHMTKLEKEGKLPPLQQSPCQQESGSGEEEEGQVGEAFAPP